MQANSTTYNLSISYDGSPFIRVAANSSSIPDTLQISADGSPWWGLSYGLTRRLKAYIGGSWIAKPLKVYISGTWVEKQLKFYNGSWQ